MQVFKEKEAARRWMFQQRCAVDAIGWVPTMGALHEGHLSLVRRSVRRCQATAASIFVNPTQFAPDEDLARYPRTLESDLEMLAGCGVDAVFVPDTEEMYSSGFSTYVQPPKVALRLEGKHRPDHFRGVTTVVAKLFHVLPCTHAFFGHKDYQQACVLEHMNRELDFGVDIEVCPTVRDADGLALSSRNRYLSGDQRSRALSLIRALRQAAEQYRTGERSTAALERGMRAVLQAGGINRIDYATVVDADNLTSHSTVPEQPIALIAAHLGGTRLIDNLRLDTDSLATA
ncbi:MAG: pantoate--beta-alanine ligase [Novipirellula sp. JB048]